MPRGQRDPRQVLRPPDPAHPYRRPLRGKLHEPEGMVVRRFPASQGPVRMADDLDGVADKIHFAKTLGVGDFQRPDQRQPFGVAVGTDAEIVGHMRNAANHHGGFDPAWVGPAASVEEHLNPASHRIHPFAGALDPAIRVVNRAFAGTGDTPIAPFRLLQRPPYAGGDKSQVANSRLTRRGPLAQEMASVGHRRGAARFGGGRGAGSRCG